MLGLQKEAQPGHMQIPPSGDQTAQADHHTQDTLRALRCGQTSPLTCVKLPGRKPVHLPLPVGQASACLKEYKSNLTQVRPNTGTLETKRFDNRV